MGEPKPPSSAPEKRLDPQGRERFGGLQGAIAEDLRVSIHAGEGNLAELNKALVERTINEQQYKSLAKLLEFRTKIDKGDESVDDFALKMALQRGEITPEDLSTFSLELLGRGNQIIEGLSKVEKRQASQIEELSTDRVTGLTKFESLQGKLGDLKNELNQVRERRERFLHSVIVVMIDIDDLRIWNSQYNHIVGDQALKVLANLLRSATRAGDDLFRRGDQSDEIIAAIRVEKDLSDEKLEEIFNTIKEKINTGFLEIEGKKIAVTAAVGYTIMKPGDPRTVDQILAEVSEKEKEEKNTVEKLLRKAQAQANLEKKDK